MLRRPLTFITLIPQWHTCSISPREGNVIKRTITALTQRAEWRETGRERVKPVSFHSLLSRLAVVVSHKDVFQSEGRIVMLLWSSYQILTVGVDCGAFMLHKIT